MPQRKSASVSKQPFKLNDFDFSVDRSKMLFKERHDGSATIRIKGGNRKTSNHELVLTSFFRKHKLNFRSVAIGKHKNKSENIMVFDFPSLKNDSVPIRKYGQANGFINSKGHVKKIMEIFDIVIPEKPNAVIKIYFNLYPKVQNGKKNFNVCNISLINTFVDEKDKTFRSRKNRVKAKAPRSTEKKKRSKKSSSTDNIL